MAEKELAEKVRDVICEEWQRSGGSLDALESVVIYERLLAQEVEVANYQMSAILNAFVVGRLITLTPRQQRELTLLIRISPCLRVSSSDLCH